MSVVAVAEKGRNERIIAEARYAYDKKEDACEIAFIVDEEFQGKASPPSCSYYLVKIARDRGIARFVALFCPQRGHAQSVRKSPGWKPAGPSRPMRWSCAFPGRASGLRRSLKARLSFAAVHSDCPRSTPGQNTLPYRLNYGILPPVSDGCGPRRRPMTVNVTN
jgi:hypothetical protein